MESFVGYVSITRTGESIEDILSEYDYYELYDPEKKYHSEIFAKPYKSSCIRYYRYYLVKIITQDVEDLYVVHKRIITDINKNEHLCKCSRCKGVFKVLYRMFTCPFCTGCLKVGDGFADKNNLCTRYDSYVLYFILLLMLALIY